MGAPARDVLGQCSCPVCSSDRASARLSAKGLAYVVCDACNSQVFARSGKSDQLLRDRIKAAPKPADPAPVSEPKPLTPDESNALGQQLAAMNTAPKMAGLGEAAAPKGKPSWSIF